MTVFAVTYHYVEDPEFVTLHRPAHREYLSGLIATRQLLAAGPTSGAQGSRALLLFEVADAAEVEALIDNDPFWVEGVITEREVRLWRVALGTVGESSVD